MKIILTVECRPELKSEFEYLSHFRWQKVIFIQGDTKEAFVKFEDDNAEEIYQVILDAYELGENEFTLNFPQNHAPAFENPMKRNIVFTNLLERMND